MKDKSALGRVIALLLLATSAGMGLTIAHGRAPAAPAAATTPVQPAPAPTPAPAAARALLDQFSQAFQYAAEHVNPAVVPIFTEQQVQVAELPFGPGFGLDEFFGGGSRRQPRGSGEAPATRKAHSLGSGVIVSADGYILTNNHVVQGSSKLTVEVGGKRHQARVIGTDPQTDLAVIKIDASNLPVADLGDSDTLQVGEWVIAVGNPLELLHSVTAGIISAKGRSEVGLAAYEDFIQTDASINPGNSGGALADLEGRVVGINTAIATRTGGNVGIGFAIPINMAHRIMEELIDKGRITRGYLALMPQDLDENLAGALGLTGEHGALVAEVTADGPADKAGVRRGDVIVAFNGSAVEDANGLRKAVGAARPGREARLEILREGRRTAVTVNLGERPDPQVAAAAPESDDRTAPAHKLGLSIEPLTGELAQQLGYETGRGVLVSGVEPGGPADEAGVQRGDLIEAVGRTEVRSVDDLRRALSQQKDDSSVALLVRRGEHTFYVGVPLA